MNQTERYVYSLTMMAIYTGLIIYFMEKGDTDMVIVWGYFVGPILLFSGFARVWE